jgi:hypothetical protein
LNFSLAIFSIHCNHPEKMNMSIKPIKFRIICLLFFLVIWCCSSAIWAGEIVSAKGSSFFEPGREAIAREKAIDDAKRAAVEKVLGTVVESSTAVENQQVITERIVSRSSGYLRRVKVMEEGKTDLGAFEVTILAEVEVAALTEDIDRFRKLLEWQKNPRVAVFIEEGLDKHNLAAARKAAGLLTQKLNQNGFTVFAHPTGKDIGLGFLVGLNLELSSQQSDYQGVTLSLNEISLSATTYRAGDMEIIATASAVKSMPGVNRLQVLDDGARACVEIIWRKMRQKLIQLWEKEFYVKRDINLVINNVPSHNRAAALAAIFSSDVSGVADSRLVTYNNGKAEFILTYRGRIEQFANEIQMAYFRKAYFKSDMKRMAGNTIVIQMKNE